MRDYIKYKPLLFILILLIACCIYYTSRWCFTRRLFSVVAFVGICKDFSLNLQKEGCLEFTLEQAKSNQVLKDVLYGKALQNALTVLRIPKKCFKT